MEGTVRMEMLEHQGWSFWGRVCGILNIVGTELTNFIVQIPLPRDNPDGTKTGLQLPFFKMFISSSSSGDPNLSP